MTEQQPSKRSRWQWFIFVVCIPVLFAIGLSVAVLTVAGVDVGKEIRQIGAQIPIVNNWFDLEAYESDEQKLKREHDTLAKEKQKVEQELADAKATLDQKEQELLRLQAELDKAKRDVQTNNRSNEEIEASYRKVAKAYGEMNPKQAADIIQKLDSTESIQILKRVDNETLRGILENVTPDKAAVYTKLLLK
ncbi:MAG: hypothetical protein ACRC5C_03325 [Bacilli bacterium]